MEFIETIHEKAIWTLVGGLTFFTSSLILTQVIKWLFGDQLILIPLDDMHEIVLHLLLS